jgi:UDP-N-acetyl-alpha-D-quinovosamine dehydrogenase
VPEPCIVTGATGFVGRSLVRALGVGVVPLSMSPAGWFEAAKAVPFTGATVFHLAARVHRIGQDDHEEYLNDNAGKTRRLAELAATRGARRLVFLSSIKVIGEETTGPPFGLDDSPAPEDAYARSKLAAELAVREVASRHSIEFVIVRSPLVYGKGARGNLMALLRLADSPWPLPFASLHAPRSFVHVEDLAELLRACGRQPQAVGRTYLAAHRRPSCTRDLVAALRERLGRPQRLFALSPGVLEALGAAAGQRARVRRLTRALEVDPSAAERDLGWSASRGLDVAAADLVEAYRQDRAA